MKTLKTGNKREDERHIPYPANLETAHDQEGADAFDHRLDRKKNPYYVNNDYFNMKSQGTLHILSHFRTYQQSTEYTCGAASALMVLYHLGNEDYNEMQIAELAGTDPHKGTTVEGLVHFFESIGWKTESHTGKSTRFRDIADAEAFFVESIDAGIPVMVDWLDWKGHWQVVIGIDTLSADSPYDDVLILADPYDVTDLDQDGYYIFPFGRFFDMWREGVAAEKTVPYEQPFVKAWK